MGSGKTTVGHLLAHRLGAPFIDMDAMLTRAYGPIEEQFVSVGEATFRQREFEWLKAFSSDSTVVLATGGGVWCDERCQSVLRKHFFCVSLIVSWPVVVARLGAGTDRPLWNPESSALFEKRKIQYQWGDLFVQTDEKVPEDIVQEILQCM